MSISRSWYSGQSVLITGGLGFIGSSLALRMVELGARVTIVDSLNPKHGGNWKNIEPIRGNVRVLQRDLRDFEFVMSIVEDFAAVFHLAGQVSHGDSMRDPLNDLGINCVSSINLVEACRIKNPTARIVYTSTRQVYGRPSYLPVDEIHPLNPVDVNGVNKLSAEYYFSLYYKVYGLKSTVLRLTNTYGPRIQIKNDRQGFISVFLRRCLTDQRIDVYGDGSQIRDFNYIDDVVAALELSLLNEDCFGKTFNLGCSERVSLLGFLDHLSSHTTVNFRLVPFPEGRRLIDIGDYYGNYKLFNSLTGWQPTIGLNDGLSRTIKFFKSNLKDYI
jgi:UDP-glucose 4-epimerase